MVCRVLCLIRIIGWQTWQHVKSRFRGGLAVGVWTYILFLAVYGVYFTLMHEAEDFDRISYRFAVNMALWLFLLVVYEWMLRWLQSAERSGLLAHLVMRRYAVFWTVLIQSTAAVGSSFVLAMALLWLMVRTISGYIVWSVDILAYSMVTAVPFIGLALAAGGVSLVRKRWQRWLRRLTLFLLTAAALGEWPMEYARFLPAVPGILGFRSILGFKAIELCFPGPNELYWAAAYGLPYLILGVVVFRRCFSYLYYNGGDLLYSSEFVDPLVDSR